MIVLALAPLAAAWLLLHRASRRDGWGFVGFPPTPAQISLRIRLDAMTRAARIFREALAALAAAQVKALRDVAEAIARSGVERDA